MGNGYPILPDPMFRVIPGFLWVKFNREGYGYYPNYSGRVWILSKLDPSKKKKKKPTTSFFFLLNPLHPLKTKALVGKVLPFSKKKKKSCGEEVHGKEAVVFFVEGGEDGDSVGCDCRGMKSPFFR